MENTYKIRLNYASIYSFNDLGITMTIKVAFVITIFLPVFLAKNFGSINVNGVGDIYVVGPEWASSFVSVYNNEVHLNGGGRVYFAKYASDGFSADMWWQVPLMDKHFRSH